MNRVEFYGKTVANMRGIAAILVYSFMLSLFFACPALSGEVTDGSPVYPEERWEKAVSPEQLGWSSEKLAAARAYSERIGSAAVFIVDDGVVVGLWGDVVRKYPCHSVRKSLLSALIGIHVGEGRIDLSKTMEDLGIDDSEPSLTEAEKQATVGDLIRARSGIYHPALGESEEMKAKRPERYSHAPGEYWYYNNWDFNVLGTIFEQETGTRISVEFERRIAGPLRMEDYEVSDCRYRSRDRYGRCSIHPQYQFRMSSRDLARFGLLFLRGGRWGDRQIIPARWVGESTASHSEIGTDKGYGYMWWTGVRDGLLPHVRVSGHCFCARGYGGHAVVVLPYRNLVVVHRVDTEGGDVSLGADKIGRLLWFILDAAGDEGIGEPSFIEAAEGIRLTASEMKGLSHVTLRGFSGAEPYIVHSFPDGTMTFSTAGNFRDTGEWWFEGDRFFRRWRNLDGGRTAGFSLVLDGVMLRFFDMEGRLVETMVLCGD